MTAYSKATIDRLAKGLPIRTKHTKFFYVAGKDDAEPPSLQQVEQEEISIGNAIDEYINDRQDRQTQCCYD